MARRRRRSPRRRKPNLMLHRTRNLGVIGTRGAGVIAWTKGAYARIQDVIDRVKLLVSQDGDALITEDDILLAPER